MTVTEDVNASLIELTRIVNSTRYLDEVQEQFGTLACSLVGADRVTISIADPTARSIDNLLVHGEPFPEFEFGKHSLDFDFYETPWYYSSIPYIVDDTILRQTPEMARTEKIADQAGFRSTLVAPIQWQKNSIAAITFRSKQEQAFGSADLRVADLIAVALAGAIASHVSYAELRMGALLQVLKSPAVLDGRAKDAPKDVALLDEMAREAGLNSWLVAPMFWRGDLIGNLHFRSEKENAYGEREIRLAQQISDQIAGTVASFDAYRHLEEEALTRDTLATIAKFVSESPDFHDVLPQVREAMGWVISFDGLSFSAYDRARDEITLVYQDGFTDQMTPVGGSYHSSESYFGRVVRNGESIIKSFGNLEELDGFPRTINAFEAGTRTFASVPMSLHDEIIGLVQVRSDSPDAFGDRDLSYLGRVADQLAGAFQTYQSSADLRLQNAALEAAENAIVISDSNRIVEWVNPALTKLTGWTSDEIVGKPASTLRASGNEQEVIDAEVKEALANNLSWSGRQINRRKDGSEYIESVVITPVLDEEDQLTHVIAIKQDITDLIAADEAREREARIDHENQELQRLADSRSEFLSTVSHELRTPLTIVSSFADILFNVRSENLTAEQRNHVALIRKSSGQLAALINDLIDVSQADTGRLFMAKQPFPLAELIDEVAESFQAVLAEVDQKLEVVNVEESVTLDADRSRVTQILTNLLANASKYSSRKSTIELHASIAEDNVVLEVSDHGQGISEDDQRMVFSPFFRGKNVESGDEIGVGLGLSLVKGLVLQHDGEISLTSVPGEGTTVRVVLPGVGG